MATLCIYRGGPTLDAQPWGSFISSALESADGNRLLIRRKVPEGDEP